MKSGFASAAKPSINMKGRSAATFCLTAKYAAAPSAYESTVVTCKH